MEGGKVWADYKFGDFEFAVQVCRQILFPPEETKEEAAGFPCIL